MDLLPRLFRWSRDGAAKYFAIESLAAILRNWLRTRPDDTLAALAELCDLPFSAPVDVFTRFTIPAGKAHGRAVGLAFRGNGSLVFVDANIDPPSPIDGDQVVEYADSLAACATGKRASLVYLTGPRVARFRGETPVPVRHCRWHSVAKALSARFAGDPVLEFLTREFEALLKEIGLMLEKVDRSVIPGVRQLARLRDVVRSAIAQSARLAVASSSCNEDWMGWNVEFTAPRQAGLWIGFALGSPERLWVHPPAEKFENEIELRLHEASLHRRISVDASPWGAPCAAYLDLAACGFFEKSDPDAQVGAILDFLTVAADLVMPPESPAS